MNKELPTFETRNERPNVEAVKEMAEIEAQLEEEPQFDPNEAKNGELKKISEGNWKGEAAKVLKVLALLTSLALPIGKAEDVYAETKGDGNNIEMTEEKMQAVERLFEIIKNIPDDLEVTPAQSEWKKKRAATVIINKFMLENGGKFGKSRRELRDLMKSSNGLNDDEKRFISSVL